MALIGKIGKAFAHGGMFNGGDSQNLLAAHLFHSADDGQVVGFGAAGGENQVVVACM